MALADDVGVGAAGAVQPYRWSQLLQVQATTQQVWKQSPLGSVINGCKHDHR